MSLPPIPSPRDADFFVSNNGPEAHEDLTIAETLEIMRAPSGHRPGEQCFLTGQGRYRWVPDARVESFIASCGALHPSDYLVANGISWELRFFGGF